MTSGSFHTVPLEKIIVHRDIRQRRNIDEKDLDVLMDSIHRLGLINPITVTRDLELVAGERRYMACKKLGHDTIPVQYTDEVESLTLKLIELEENIKRLDISWADQNRAIIEYHNTRASQDKTWTQAKTAEAIGLSAQHLSSHFMVASEAKVNPKIYEIPRLSTAIGIAERSNSRRDEKSLQALRESINVTVEKNPPSIINADFMEWVKTYEGPRFNFIHCDFPYGINADNIKQGGSVATHGSYDDDEVSYWKLLESFATNLDKICAESAHIMFWFSMHHYADTIVFFQSNTPFSIDPFPLVWLKSDNIGLLPDPHRGPRRIYETCLFGSRGDRKIISSVSNAYAAPTDRTSHMSTKAEPVLRHFFRMFVDQNSLVLDPTCGSGVSLRAAESLGAAHILGVEINKDFTERANLNVEAARRMRR